MPVIDGYNEQETGSNYAGFAVGKHDVTVTSAKFESGTSKNTGNEWTALLVGLEDENGVSDTEFVSIPKDTADWQSWSNGRRKATKGQLDALGLDMALVEDDQARGLLIGKPLKIEVKQNGEYKNTYFNSVETATPVGLPGPEAVAAPVATLTV